MSEKQHRSEGRRLAALHQYEVLDTPPEESFDRITRLAKSALRVPIVLVSLVDSQRQWFKSRQGLEVTETAREISFCTHTIQQDTPFIVQDALEDPRFRDNPLVTDAPKIRFYAGIPLKTPDGSNIGTLCAIDRTPRKPSSNEISLLHDLARLVVDELELRFIATTDSLTGAQTPRSFHMDVNREIDRAKRYKNIVSFVAFDIDHFKSINDTYGHAAGDLVLQNVAAICKSTLRTLDLFGRLGGEEFMIALPETDRAGAINVAERLRKDLAGSIINDEVNEISVTASFGVTVFTGENLATKDVLKRADEALYEAKAAGRNTVVFIGGDEGVPEVA